VAPLPDLTLAEGAGIHAKRRGERAGHCWRIDQESARFGKDTAVERIDTGSVRVARGFCAIAPLQQAGYAR
jgi:hypothetical protein